MDSSMPGSGPGRRTRRLVGGARFVQRSLAAGAVVVLLVSGSTAALHMTDGAPTPAEPAWVVDAERLAERYGCSVSGLPEGVIPARTVVRVEGTVRTASFDEGWAMHLGKEPGTLVSVCAR